MQEYNSLSLQEKTQLHNLARDIDNEGRYSSFNKVLCSYLAWSKSIGGPKPVSSVNYEKLAPKKGRNLYLTEEQMVFIDSLICKVKTLYKDQYKAFKKVNCTVSENSVRDKKDSLIFILALRDEVLVKTV